MWTLPIGDSPTSIVSQYVESFCCFFGHHTYILNLHSLLFFAVYFGRDMGMIAGYETYGGEYLSNGKPCRHFRSDIFPTKRQWAYDGQFALNFPAQPEQLLQRYYGLGWRIPLTDDSSHGKPREICDTNYGVEELEELEKEYVMDGGWENN